MNGMPDDLYVDLQNALEECDDIFDEQRNLSNFFVDRRLKLWKSRLPGATQMKQRINLTIGYLLSKRNAQQENGLCLFVSILAESYEAEDDRHHKLTRIAQRIQESIQPSIQVKQEQGEVREEQAKTIREEYASQVQANPRREPMVSMRSLGKHLECSKAVARIEVSRYRQGARIDEGTGTGWLIAPGLCVTCWHVVTARSHPREVIAEEDIQQQLRNMTVTFAYVEEGKGCSYRVEELVYPQNDYVNYQEDYAILRLADRQDYPLDERPRLKLDVDFPFTTTSEIVIIQHPLGQSMKSAEGRYMRDAEQLGRIWYNTSTEIGTSGAPLLNKQNWQVVGLHNAENHNEQLREGTKIKFIVEQLWVECKGLYDEIAKAQEWRIEEKTGKTLPREIKVHASSSDQQRVVALKYTVNKLVLNVPKPLPSYEEKRLMEVTIITIEKELKWLESRPQSKLGIYFRSVNTVIENMHHACKEMYSALNLVSLCLSPKFTIDEVRACTIELNRSLREYQVVLKKVLKQFKKI